MSTPRTPKEALADLRREWKTASPDERHEVQRHAAAVKLIDKLCGRTARQVRLIEQGDERLPLFDVPAQRASDTSSRSSRR
jgi:hypothetical protein